MASGLLDIVKIASQQAQEAGQPTDLRIGTVTSVKPLKVQISNQLTIPSSLLVVPEHLTDHEIEVEMDWTTTDTSGGGTYEAFASHNHKVTGKKKMKVYNALKKNDKVALLRKAGGQQFLIIDRI